MLMKMLKKGIACIICVTISLSGNIVYATNNISENINEDLSEMSAFSETEDNSLSEGIYYIKNIATGKYLEATEDENAVVSSFHGKDNQKWRIEYLENGLYKIHTMWYTLDGLMLDVESYGEHANADLYHDKSLQDYVSFDIIENNDGTYRIMSTWGTFESVLRADPSQINLTSVNAEFYTYDGSDYQKWIFEDATPRTHTSGITSGMIYSIENTFSSKNMEASGSSEAEKANVIQCSLTGLANQDFWIKYVSDGEYKISPVYAKNMVLSLDADKKLVLSTDNNTNVDMKRWYIMKSEDEYYIICKAYKGEVLSVNGSTTAGASIYSSKNTSGARWDIYNGYKYAAFVNNYYDYGFTVRYGITESQAKTRIYNYTEEVANRYEEIFNLRLYHNASPEYFNSLVDQCKGTVTTENIGVLCEHEEHKSATNVCGNFLDTRLNRDQKTITNAYWTGHSFGDGYNDRSFSWYDMIFMSGQSRTESQQKGTLMHELNHQFGASDHYHNAEVGAICDRKYCSTCGGEYARPSDCVMNLGRYVDIYSDDVLCVGCMNEIKEHLSDHHK